MSDKIICDYIDEKNDEINEKLDAIMKKLDITDTDLDILDDAIGQDITPVINNTLDLNNEQGKY